MKALPKNHRDPTDCTNGWFYVTPTGIEIVAKGIAVITRSQLLAALKVMGKPSSKNRKRNEQTL